MGTQGIWLMQKSSCTCRNVEFTFSGPRSCPGLGGLCPPGLLGPLKLACKVWHNHSAPFLLFRVGEPSIIARMSRARPAGLRFTFMDHCSGWTKF